VKKSMPKLVTLGLAIACASGAAAQSPYPHRSYAEKFDCRATALPQFTGQTPNIDVARQLLTSSGAKKLRWLQVGEVPGKQKKGRVTAQLDALGRIATAYCG
jgi:hypothetical protein